MTINFPISLIIVVVSLVLPYLWCRFVKQLPCEFRDLDHGDQVVAYIATVLYWNGGLGLFTFPYVLMGWLPLLAALIVAWAIALGLSLVGSHLGSKLTDRLSKTQCRRG